MKKSLKLILLACVSLVLVLLCFLIPHLTKEEAEEESSETTESESYTLLTLDAENASRVSLKTPDTTLVFEEKDGVWYSSENETVPLTESLVITMLGKAKSIVSNHLVIRNCEDLSEYGLSPARYELTLTVAGKDYSLLYGSYESVHYSAYYFALGGADDVYMMDDTLISAFSKSVDDLVSFDTLPDYEDITDIGISSFSGETKLLSEDALSSLSDAVKGLSLSSVMGYEESDTDTFGMDAPATLKIVHTVTSSFEKDESGGTLDASVEYETLYKFGRVQNENGEYSYYLKVQSEDGKYSPYVYDFDSTDIDTLLDCIS